MLYGRHALGVKLVMRGARIKLWTQVHISGTREHNICIVLKGHVRVGGCPMISTQKDGNESESTKRGARIGAGRSVSLPANAHALWL